MFVSICRCGLLLVLVKEPWFVLPACVCEQSLSVFVSIRRSTFSLCISLELELCVCVCVCACVCVCVNTLKLLLCLCQADFFPVFPEVSHWIYLWFL